MLAQRAERAEIVAAVQIWAPVYPVGVDRASEVLVEADELMEHGVAHEALVRLLTGIPRELRGQ